MHIGAVVELKSRITMEFPMPDEKVFRRDVAKGSQGPVKGFVGGKLVVEFEADLPKQGLTKADVALKPSKVELAETTKTKALAAEPKKGSKPIKFPSEIGTLGAILAKTLNESDEVKYVTDWGRKQQVKDDASKGENIKSMARAILGMTQTLCPTYGPADIHILEINGKYTLYAAKGFAAVGALAFTPDTSEFKDRLWTYNKSQILENSESLMQKATGIRKPIVLDGRLRADIDQNDRPFALYWLVERSTNDKECNMCIKEVETSAEFRMMKPWDGLTNIVSHAVKDLPQISVMYNYRPVKKNERLVVYDDGHLKKMSEKYAAERLKEKADNDKKGKKNKAEGEAGAEDTSTSSTSKKSKKDN